MFKKFLSLVLCLFLLPLSAFAEDETVISLLGDTAQVTGDGVTVDGNIITITNKGTYRISGSLTGQLVVNVEKEKKVTLVLDGAAITSDTLCPLLVLSSPKNTVLELLGDNTVTDSRPENDSEEQNAAVYSADDLTITGDGSLTVTGSSFAGIYCEDDLVIESGSLTVTAAGAGLRGTDSVTVSGGVLQITSGTDGIRSTQAEKDNKGFVALTGGNITIVSGGDGVYAAKSLTVADASLDITAGGGSGNGKTHSESFFGSWGSTASSDDVSSKGLKSDDTMTISGGVIELDCADDALHATGNLTVDGGDISIATGDDALHSDALLTINNGTIQASTCYEGLEGAQIVINGGSISITSSDDGINATGSSSSSTGGASVSGMGSMSGGDSVAASAEGTVMPNGMTMPDASFDPSATPGAMPDGASMPSMPDGATVPSMPDGASMPSMPGGGSFDASVTPPAMPDGTSSDAAVTADASVSQSSVTPDASYSSGRMSGFGGFGFGGFGGGMGGGMGGFGESADASVIINGGDVYLNAGGDGFDSNGSMEMNDGTLVIAGPSSSANGAIDYASTFTMNGGILVAAGASGMAQNVSSTSTQPGVYLSVSGGDGTYLQILDESGKAVLGYLAEKSFDCVVVSSPDITLNSTYTLLSGTAVPDGVAESGLYTGDTAVDGTTKSTFTVSSVTTSVGGSSFGGMGGFGGFGGW